MKLTKNFVIYAVCHAKPWLISLNWHACVVHVYSFIFIYMVSFLLILYRSIRQDIVEQHDGRWSSVKPLLLIAGKLIDVINVRYKCSPPYSICHKVFSEALSHSKNLCFLFFFFNFAIWTICNHSHFLCILIHLRFHSWNNVWFRISHSLILLNSRFRYHQTYWLMHRMKIY